MKNKLRRDIFVIIFLLLVACIALAVPLAFSNPRWLLAPALLVVFALVVAVLGIRRLRRFVADMLCGTNFEGSKTQYSLADFSIPTALIIEGSVVWYNPAFREQILAGQDALLAAPVQGDIVDAGPRPGNGQQVGVQLHLMHIGAAHQNTVRLGVILGKGVQVLGQLAQPRRRDRIEGTNNKHRSFSSFSGWPWQRHP